MDPRIVGSAIGDRFPLGQLDAMQLICNTLTVQVGIEVHVLGHLGKTFSVHLDTELL